MWLIISAICILVTILEMFSRTQFFTKTGGCRIFFSRPVAGLTNRGHVRDFRAGAPLRVSVVWMGYLATYFPSLLINLYAPSLLSNGFVLSRLLVAPQSVIQRLRRVTEPKGCGAAIAERRCRGPGGRGGRHLWVRSVLSDRKFVRNWLRKWRNYLWGNIKI